MRWTVTAVERKDRLDGWIVQVDGDARSARGVLIERDRHAAARWARRDLS